MVSTSMSSSARIKRTQIMIENCIYYLIISCQILSAFKHIECVSDLCSVCLLVVPVDSAVLEF